jgi:predicted HTH domain antitoxin
MGIMIEIPKDISRSMKVPESELSQRIRVELALRLYQIGVLTLGKARRLAGTTKWDFQLLLGRERILRRYDVAELEKDLSTLEKLNARGK